MDPEILEKVTELVYGQQLEFPPIFADKLM